MESLPHVKAALTAAEQRGYERGKAEAVPTKITEKMRKAFVNAQYEHDRHWSPDGDDSVTIGLRAALAAAPSPASKTEEKV